MRFGLVGTGSWAREVHAAAIAAAPSCQLAGVWGRDPAKTQRLAADLGAAAYGSPDELFAEVDAVSFAVPPDVQAGLATAAAAAGRHLLLEKPIATSTAAADRLAAAVRSAGVASVVFFTSRFQPDLRRWLEELAQEDGSWHGGTATWLCEAFAPGSPFDTPWRHDKGGLWDVGPHALSVLWAALGPITDVVAAAGPAATTHLILDHDGRATSTAALSLETPTDACRVGVELWGNAGRTVMPPGEVAAVDALVTALEELVASAAQPTPTHPCDVEFGRRIVEVLARAEAQL